MTPPLVDLVVCIRCHDYPSLVADTFDSLQWSCGSTTAIMLAVDGRPPFAETMRKWLGCDVFCSDRRWGWGVGLYGLLADAIRYAHSRYGVTHFLSVDYDTLALRKGADAYLLHLVDNEDIGLIGHHNVDNKRWAEVYEQDKSKIIKTWGPAPPTYIPGEGIQGGCFLTSTSMQEQMIKLGMLSEPYRTAAPVTTLPDDHLVTLLCRMCGLRIVEAGKGMCVQWRAATDPRGLEDKGVFWFHPTKLRPENPQKEAELKIRNYFRGKRGRRGDLK